MNIVVCLQVILAEWGKGEYYFSKVVEENPLRMMFTFEPITSRGEIKITNKSLKWNKHDQQLADKEYIVCYMLEDMVTTTKAGLKIIDKDDCIDFMRNKISEYEL